MGSAELHLRSGDLIEVRSAAEILRTLDADGTLNGLPFMPEMLAFCGRRFRVFQRAEKTCVEGALGGIREFRNNDVVLLETLRCSGLDHGGCQRSCRLFWKEAWLRTVNCNETPSESRTEGAEQVCPRLKTTARQDQFVCQSTELVQATKPLSHLHRAWKCFRDVWIGNYRLLQMVRQVMVPIRQKVLRKFVGRYPRGNCTRTPVEELHLQPGELVEVRPLEEIVPTLDAKGRNRGLQFGFDMRPFCGARYRVKGRLDRMIIETTGQLQEIQNTVILDGVTCPCHYVVGGCPRGELIFWREIWLKRVESDSAGSGELRVKG